MAAAHYALDTAYGWVIFRAAFPWPGKRRPKIKSLSLTMEQQPCRVPGPHFTAHAQGEVFTFSHPISGTEYTLTVQELAQQTLPQNRINSDRWRYPNHFTAMSYTLSPVLDTDISLCDCAEGDRPLEIAPCTDRYAPKAQNDIACIGIIGGAAGPALTAGQSSPQEKLGAACSALHFEAAEKPIEWRIEFSIVQFPQKTFRLI